MKTAEVEFPTRAYQIQDVSSEQFSACSGAHRPGSGLWSRGKELVQDAKNLLNRGVLESNKFAWPLSPIQQGLSFNAEPDTVFLHPLDGSRKRKSTTGCPSFPRPRPL